MTLAEQFKAQRRPDYADLQEYLELVASIDPDAIFMREGDRELIQFSDDSVYVMESS